MALGGREEEKMRSDEFEVSMRICCADKEEGSRSVSPRLRLLRAARASAAVEDDTWPLSSSSEGTEGVVDCSRVGSEDTLDRFTLPGAPAMMEEEGITGEIGYSPSSSSP